MVVSGNVAYTPYNNGFVCSLAQLTNASDFTNLFEQYQITDVQYDFYMEISPDAQGGSTSVWPKLYACTDWDDATPPTLAELRERSATVVKVLDPAKPVSIKFKPTVLVTGYKTAVTSGYIPTRNVWIDTVDATVPHYGLKFAIDNLTNINYTVRVEAIVWLKCKGQQ